MSQYRPLHSNTGVDAAGKFPDGLRRGIALRELFRKFGAILRVRPDSLQENEKAALYAASMPVEALSFFLSHCWSSSGFRKYIAALLHFMQAPALMFTVMTARAPRIPSAGHNSCV